MMQSQIYERRIKNFIKSSEFKNIIQIIVQKEINYIGNFESAIKKLYELKYSSTIPINDLSCDKLNYSEEDSSNRCEFASLFRLIDMAGWAKSLYNNVSLRSNDNNNNYYINPFGLSYHEITAASLLQVNIEGIILDSGNSILGINCKNWLIHKAIFTSRKDVKCIIQISLPDVVAISSSKSGLLPLSFEAVKLLDVSPKSFSGGGVKYHSPNFEKDCKYDQLISDLGKSNIIFVRNYCLLVCASSITEAWSLLKTVVRACEAQVCLIQLGCMDLLNAESNFTKMNTIFSDAYFHRQHSIKNGTASLSSVDDSNQAVNLVPMDLQANNQIRHLQNKVDESRKEIDSLDMASPKGSGEGYVDQLYPTGSSEDLRQQIITLFQVNDYLIEENAQLFLDLDDKDIDIQRQKQQLEQVYTETESLRKRIKMLEERLQIDCQAKEREEAEKN